MGRKNILIVEDEKELSEIISEMLTGCGYSAVCAENAEKAYKLLSRQTFHLILLDINLPDATGFEICKQLREASKVPVIFASARTSEDDRINSFDIGGDDFLQKPYSMKELLSRINALMRRAYGSDEEQLMCFGDIKVNAAERTVTRAGQPVKLSQREFDLLCYLCRNMNTAIPKETLISEVWGAFSEVEPSTLTVHIRWLREKLEDDPAEPKYIKTIWRLGYMLSST